MGNPIIRVVTTVGGSVAYIALAVFGWGSISGFFSHNALIAVTIVQLLAGLAAVFVGGNLSSGVKEDRSNRWVLPLFTVLGLLLGWLPAWTDGHNVWSFGNETVRWIGVALFALGGYLRLWPVYVLGNRFSGLVAIQANHKLKTDGIYKVVRNPSYLGMIVIGVGWSLVFRSVAGLILTALIVATLVARMNAEERLLREQFGAEYDAYYARTCRLLPGIY